MQKDVLVLSKRKNTLKSTLIVFLPFCIFTVFFIIDIILYMRDKYTWEYVFMIISAVLDGLSLFILIFGAVNGASFPIPQKSPNVTSETRSFLAYLHS